MYRIPLRLSFHAADFGSLDFWNYPAGKRTPVVPEPRLREKLMERLSTLEAPIQLSATAPFRLPPAGDGQDPAPWNSVQVLEFPEWFVCQSSICRALVGKSAEQRDAREPRRLPHHPQGGGSHSRCVRRRGASDGARHRPAGDAPSPAAAQR